MLNVREHVREHGVLGDVGEQVDANGGGRG